MGPTSSSQRQCFEHLVLAGCQHFRPNAIQQYRQCMSHFLPVPTEQDTCTGTYQKHTLLPLHHTSHQLTVPVWHSSKFYFKQWYPLTVLHSRLLQNNDSNKQKFEVRSSSGSDIFWHPFEKNLKCTVLSKFNMKRVQITLPFIYALL